MRQRFFRLVLAFCVPVFLFGCGGSTQPANSAAGEDMSPAEARTYLAEVQAARGVKPAAPQAVTSMEQLLEILSGDEVARFEDAERFVEGKPGIDALTLHAAIELSWSDAYSTVAAIADELAKRAALEADRLQKKRDQGRDLVESETRALEQAQKDAAMLAKARGALRVLAKDHLGIGGASVAEALRQFRTDPRSYRVAAFLYVLSEDWERFDEAMAWFAGEKAAGDAGIQYLRALEALKRFTVKKEASRFLGEALRLDPKMVRAQAKLVLVQEEIGATHAELEKLRALSPQHPVINVAGPSIVSAYETSVALAAARGPEPAPASGPASTPATPTPAPAPATPAPVPATPAPAAQ